jgi:hypothetical protein
MYLPRGQVRIIQQREDLPRMSDMGPAQTQTMQFPVPGRTTLLMPDVRTENRTSDLPDKNHREEWCLLGCYAVWLL